MSDSTEPRSSTSFPPGTGAAASLPADPLAGDWSEGLPGPVRALGIPAPRLLAAQGAEAEAPATAAPVDDGTVEAPDAWSVAADDPLHSVPPPVARERADGIMLENALGPPAGASALETALAAASSQHAEVAALAELPPEDDVVEVPTEGALDGDDGLLELRASDALDHEPVRGEEPAAGERGESTHALGDDRDRDSGLEPHDAELIEAEPLGASEGGEAAAQRTAADAWTAAAHASGQDGAEEWSDPPPSDAGAPAAAQDLWQAVPVPLPAPTPDPGAAAAAADPAWNRASPAVPPPAWDGSAAADLQPGWMDAPTAVMEAGWGAVPAAPEPAGSSKARGSTVAAPADWGAGSSAPDWSAAPPASPGANHSWGAPPAAAETVWAQGAAAAPVAEWTGPTAPVPAAPEAAAAPPLSTMQQMLSEEFEPPPPEPHAKLFAPLAAGASLSLEENMPIDGAPIEAMPIDETLPLEEATLIDEDPDLLVPIEEEQRAPLAQIEPVAVAGDLAVQGEHRVAVHTRGGRTLRGSVSDIDLAKSQFALLPQGGANPEAIYHAEVKAIFFMLPPGEKPRPASGRKVRVTFADGRSIEGTREGGEGQHGFFLLPADAARTNTRRIYVARDAIAELKDV